MPKNFLLFWFNNGRFELEDVFSKEESESNSKEDEDTVPQMTVTKEVNGKPEYTFDMQALGFLLLAMSTCKWGKNLKSDSPISAFYADTLRKAIPKMNGALMNDCGW